MPFRSLLLTLVAAALVAVTPAVALAAGPAPSANRAVTSMGSATMRITRVSRRSPAG